MHPIWIILKSEFGRRVRSKWFILTTLLGPLAMIAFFVIVGIVAITAFTGDGRTVAVVDETGVLLADLLAAEASQHSLVDAGVPADSVRQAVLDGQLDGYLLLPADLLTATGVRATYFAVEGGGFGLENWLEGEVRRAVQSYRIRERNVPPDVVEILRTTVPVRMVKLTQQGEAAGDTGIYSVIGFIMGFLIYLTMLIYGSVVMQGVIEEKTSRIVEVIVASARPFHLLMGKVLGIGAMGLVQMTTWAVFILLGLTFAGSVTSLFLDPASLNLPETASQQEMLAAADFTMPSLSLSVFVWFVLFFLVGYLLYASLFAAVGAAVQQQQETQGLMLPLMLPLILSIVFLQSVIESPHSALAVGLSLFPLTAPVPMVVRLAVTDVPFWEVGLSFALLCGGFLGAIWISSRIYRVGILMYGKKARFKDLIRWFRYA